MPLPSPDRIFTLVRGKPRPHQAVEQPPEPPEPEPGSQEPPSRWTFPLRHPFRTLAIAIVCVTLLPVVLGRVIPIWTSSFMLGYHVERVFSDKPLPPLQHDWVSWDRIAPAARLAVVASEDQKFPDHFGFDLEAIEDAREHNEHSRRMRGASTISQQTAKNLFLWSGRSWIRKGFEVGYTVLLETFWSKRRILEVYLNVAEFGPGVYGVEAASQKYFHKPAASLGFEEAALLAAVLPNPRRLRVDAPSLYVRSRAAQIESQMRHLGTQYVNF